MLVVNIFPSYLLRETGVPLYKRERMKGAEGRSSGSKVAGKVKDTVGRDKGAALFASSARIFSFRFQLFFRPVLLARKNRPAL